jgi:3-deoxy-manno-octulosonate cytidylyltransferase (CMP-KDO synthetase)
MVWRVYERVRKARRVDRILVATDDERIAAAVRAEGGEAVMTGTHHATGTDRVAEAATTTDAEIVVNVQGDEPMLDPKGIDAAVEAMLADPTLDITTLSLPLTTLDDMLAPSVVKVVTDLRGRALYFSRAPIPFHRGTPAWGIREAAQAAVSEGLTRKHVGLYAFRRAALEKFASLRPTILERTESLEQLRALENGMSIGVAAISGVSGIAVDTPEDLEKVRAILAVELEPKGVRG